MTASRHKSGVFLLLALAAAGQEPQPDFQPALDAGRSEYLKANYEAAQTSLELAWKIAQETLPPNAEKRYEILKQLAAVHASQGEFKEAITYLDLAIDWRSTNLGFGDPLMVDDLTELARVLRSSGDYRRAITVLEPVAVHLNRTGQESAALADTHSFRAQLYLDLKQPEAAAVALRIALDVREKLSGSLHPSLVRDLDKLGQVLITLRDYVQAEQAYRRSLVIRERLVGPKDADLITTVDGLAYAHFGQKKYAEAESLYRRLLSLWEGSAGKDHPMIAITLDKVAVFYREQKRLEEAGAAAEQANAIRTLFLAQGLVREATARLSLGEKDAALALFRSAAEHLDAPRPEYQELHKQIHAAIQTLGGPAKPAPKRGVGTPPRPRK